MPWQTLELDPAVATAKDVKRAYAKRLKTCRPDHDPEGFRLLHEAYTAALGELQWRGNSGDSAPPSDPLPFAEIPASPTGGATTEIPAPAIVAPPLSPGLEAVVEVMDRLDLALKSQREGVAALVREAESVLQTHPSEVQRWGEIMHDLIRDHARHEELRLKPEAILFELEHNGVAATIAVIDRIDRDGNPRAISGLSELFTGNKKRIATPAGGIAAARLAGAAAFWARGHVEPLANLAYENLARGERDFHMQMIDHHAGMRGFLSMVPDHLRSFLRQRLIHAGGSEVWSSEEGAAVIRWLQTPQARVGPVYEVVRKLLPEDLAMASGLFAEPEAPDTVSLSSRASGGTTRERRRPSSGSRPLPKPTDELEWDEAVPVSESLPRREPPPRREPSPATAGPEPTPAVARENWLDLENQTSRRSSGRASQVDSRARASSQRSFWWTIFLIAIAVKVVLFLVKLGLAGRH